MEISKQNEYNTQFDIDFLSLNRTMSGYNVKVCKSFKTAKAQNQFH